MKTCIAVFGPTASGKSSLGLRLAKELNGVIISADSMQIYREMDVGTAKPSASEQAEIPHRMIDICDPTDKFSVYDYKAMAENEIRSTFCQGLQPIIVGGTGLYLDALFYNTNFGDFEIDPDFRMKLKERSEKEWNHALLNELSKIDPDSAAPLHEKDTKRILRALEVYYSTGKTLNEFKEESRKEASEFDFLKFYLVYRDRQTLYDRINKRVDEMLEQDLLNETESLLRRGLLTGTTAAQAIGYKEFVDALNDRCSMEDAVALVQQSSRKYAKRQLTWFRRNPSIHWLIRQQGEKTEEILCRARQILVENDK